MIAKNIKAGTMDISKLKKHLQQTLGKEFRQKSQLVKLACMADIHIKDDTSEDTTNLARRIVDQAKTDEEICRLVSSAFILSPEPFENELDQFVKASLPPPINLFRVNSPGQLEDDTSQSSGIDLPLLPIPTELASSPSKPTVPALFTMPSDHKRFWSVHLGIWASDLPRFALVSILLLLFFAVSILNRDVILNLVNAQDGCDPEKLCILVTHFNEPSTENEITLQTNIRATIEAALGNRPYKVVTVSSNSRQEASALVKEYGALIALGGGFLDSNPNKQGRLLIWSVWNDELELVERSGIRPSRILPSTEFSSIVPSDFDCSGCSDMSGHLDAHIQYVSLIADGLYSYLHGYGNEAKGSLYNALQLAPPVRMPESGEPQTIEKLTQERRKLLYYYIGKSFALDGDYSSAVACLQAAITYHPSTNSPLRINREQACDIVVQNPMDLSLFEANSPFLDYSDVAFAVTDPAIFISLAQVYLYWLNEHGYEHSKELLGLAEDALNAQSTLGSAGNQLAKRLFNHGLIYKLRSQLVSPDQRVPLLEESLRKYQALGEHFTLYQYETLIQQASLSQELGLLTGNLQQYADAEQYINSARMLNSNFIWAYRAQVLLYATWLSAIDDHSPQHEAINIKLQDAQAYLEQTFADHMYMYVTWAEKCTILGEKSCSLTAIDKGIEKFADSGWYQSYAIGIYWRWSENASMEEQRRLLDKALLRYEVAKGLRPRDPALPAQLGYFYERICQSEEAEVYFATAQKLAFSEFTPADYFGQPNPDCTDETSSTALHN